MASKWSTFVKMYAPDFESGYVILLFSTRSGAEQFCESHQRVSITSSAFARKVMLRELKNLQRELGYKSKIAKRI